MKVEILQENILKMISEKHPPHWAPECFKDQIVINLPDSSEDYRTMCRRIKNELLESVRQYFPERDSELSFGIRNGSSSFSFKVGKTLSDHSSI